MNFRTAASLIASTLAFGITSARAADLPIKAPPLAAPLSWTGFYVGGNIGAQRGNSDYDTVCPVFNAATCPVLLPPFVFGNVIPGIGVVPTIVPGAFSTLPGGGASDTSFLIGGQAGYNWQINKWVFGVEGDVDATRIRTSLTRNALPAVAGAPPGLWGTVAATSLFGSDWTASIRGRVGITSGAFLFYGTAGVAFADSSVNTGFVYTPPANALPGFNIQAGPVGARGSQTLVGWTAGVGAEWMVNKKVSVGAEYRHSDFGTQSYLVGFDVSFPSAPVYQSVKYTTDQVTLRANWHLN